MGLAPLKVPSALVCTANMLSYGGLTNWGVVPHPTLLPLTKEASPNKSKLAAHS